MKPFGEGFGFNDAYLWLGFNADGDCSVLINLKFGTHTVTTVYNYSTVGTHFRSLYGPVKTLAVN